MRRVVFRCGPMLSAGTASASSRKPLCGVFRHVLFPRTRKATTAFASHEENWFVFSRSHHLPLTRTMKWLYADFCARTTIANGSKCNTSGEKHGDSLKKKTAFSACDDFQRSLPCPVGAEA